MNYKDISKVINIFDVLKDVGYTIKVEKDFPFFDCMIQLYLPTNQKDLTTYIDHIDLYFYRENEKGYWMRNLYYPKGKFKIFIAKLLHLSRVLVNITYQKNNWKLIMQYIPIYFKKKLSRFIVLLVAKQIICRYNFIPKRYYNKFINYEFNGQWLRIPYDTENYLSYLYGVTWKEPNLNWNWRKDGPTQKVRPAKMFPPPILFLNNVEN